MIKLYPHQKQVLENSINFNRVAYYYDMGLGKTFIGSEKMRQLDHRVNLLVCQKSKVKEMGAILSNNTLLKNETQTITNV